MAIQRNERVKRMWSVGVLPALLCGGVVAPSSYFIGKSRDHVGGPPAIKNMNAIVLAEPLEIVRLHWNGTGTAPSNAQCVEVNNVLGAAMRSGLGTDWAFKGPKGTGEPGRLGLKHAPTDLEWVAIIELETDNIAEPRTLSWVIRCVLAKGNTSDAYTQENFAWAWRDLNGKLATALATATTNVQVLQWSMEMP
jgi:hypothetical protein